MNSSVSISKNIEKSLKQSAPEILDSYQSFLEILEDIEIKD
ncbi:hypothetical protein [Nitrosopumilus ureiphilus]|nr:hypothetical protein [Nitrosopumilus ureiphilus]